MGREKELEKMSNFSQQLQDVLSNGQETHRLLNQAWIEYESTGQIELKTLIEIRDYFGFDDSE